MAKKTKIKRTLLALLTCQISTFVFAQNNTDDKELDYLSLSLEELGKIKVSIATGNETPIEQAPAVASVITAEDIKGLGLQDLDDILQIVPGLHVSVSPITYTPIYTFRGIRGTLNNPEILMLINGIPITSVFAGDRGPVWGGLPANNISRIEVIRGPGSSLYGADAFAGVINIITKTTKGFRGVETGVRLGSFDSANTWIIGSEKFGQFESTGYLSVGTTNGHDRTINSDAQTANDNAFGTTASLAPDSVNTNYNSLDGSFDIANQQWRFRSGLNIRENLGDGAGTSQALNLENEHSSLRWTTDLTYNPQVKSSNWQPEIQASYMYYREKSELTLFPAGTDFSAVGGGSFPDGIIGNPEKWERHYRTSASGLYTGFDNHNIRIGIGYTVADLYKIRESKNFEFVGVLPTSLGSVIDVSNTAPFIRPRKRTVKYVYAQDEWNFATNWILTSGIRYDNYSDFGSTTNPRLALVWNTSDAVTSKLLYGEAFRAPAFNELYSESNPVITGNSNLEPQKIKTLEAAINWKTSPSFNLGANIFRYEMTDIIRYVPNDIPASGSTAANIGEQTGQGLELEFIWGATAALRIQGNYGLQQSEDKVTGRDAGLAPEHTAHLRGDWQFAQHWTANMQINWVADRRREPNDTREEIDDYTLVNLSLRKVNPNKNWSLSFSILNIFDEDAREPSPGPGPTTGATVLIPDDLPLAGRSVFAQLIYQL